MWYKDVQDFGQQVVFKYEKFTPLNPARQELRSNYLTGFISNLNSKPLKAALSLNNGE